MSELPLRLAVDAKGFCWRVFDDGTWSMASVNPDNAPIPKPVTFYEPEGESHRWLYAVWMAFLADEATHELQHVLKNLSAFMWERESDPPEEPTP